MKVIRTAVNSEKDEIFGAIKATPHKSAFEPAANKTLKTFKAERCGVALSGENLVRFSLGCRAKRSAAGAKWSGAAK